MGNEPGAPTKFSQYVEPGGSDYKETVLAMKSEAPREIISGKPNRMGFAWENRQTGVTSPWFETQDAATNWLTGLTPEVARNYEGVSLIETLGGMSGEGGRKSIIPPKSDYTDSHFPDVPNYVAHMRTNERTDASGKPGLFIEEFQSGRHQKGRKDGYQGDTSDAAVRAMFGPYTDEQWQAIDPAIKEDLRNELKEGGSHLPKGVADAPYRTTWPLALFKRALRDAVAGGKEWIGWTTGQTQAERYDLSKQVDEIHSWPDGESKDGEPMWLSLIHI